MQALLDRSRHSSFLSFWAFSFDLCFDVSRTAWYLLGITLGTSRLLNGLSFGNFTGGNLSEPLLIFRGGRMGRTKTGGLDILGEGVSESLSGSSADEGFRARQSRRLRV